MISGAFDLGGSGGALGGIGALDLGGSGSALGGSGGALGGIGVLGGRMSNAAHLAASSICALPALSLRVRC